MFKKLYDELSKTEWKYHILQNFNESAIEFKGISLDPNGVSEVMRIKEVVDNFFFHTRWDGENILIQRSMER